MKMHFHKFQGNGNDFILLDNCNNKIYISNAQVQKLCNRRFGIGADDSEINLSEIPENYLPRTNYLRACDEEIYKIRTPKIPWVEKKRVDKYYRFSNRRMFGSTAERSLISSIVPQEISHLSTMPMF